MVWKRQESGEDSVTDRRRFIGGVAVIAANKVSRLTAAPSWRRE